MTLLYNEIWSSRVTLKSTLFFCVCVYMYYVISFMIGRIVVEAINLFWSGRSFSEQNRKKTILTASKIWFVGLTGVKKRHQFPFSPWPAVELLSQAVELDIDRKIYVVLWFVIFHYSTGQLMENWKNSPPKTFFMKNQVSVSKVHKSL